MWRFLRFIVGLILILVLISILMTLVSIAVPRFHYASGYHAFPQGGGWALMSLFPLAILLLFPLCLLYLIRALAGSKQENGQGLKADEQRILREMHQGMAEMEQRVGSLEVILMGREKSYSREL